MRKGQLTIALLTAMLGLLFFVGCEPLEDPEALAAEQEAADLEAIRQVIAEYITAYNNGDQRALAALFTAEAVQMPPNSSTLRGRDRIRDDFGATFADFDGQVQVNIEDSRFSGDFAVARGTWAVSLTPKAGGDPQENVGKWLNMMERQPDGTWRISTNIFNSDQSIEQLARSQGLIE